MPEAGVGQNGQIAPSVFLQHLQRHPVIQPLGGGAAQGFAHQQAGDALQNAHLAVFPQAGAIAFLGGRSADLKEKDHVFPLLRRREQLPHVGEHLEAAAQKPPLGHAATQRAIARVGDEISPRGLGLFRPGQLGAADHAAGLNVAHRRRVKEHPFHHPAGIRVHLPRLAEVVEHVGAVKAGEPRVQTEKIGDCPVGIAGEDLRIVPQNGKIQKRQHADAVAAADDVEHRPDAFVRKGLHQVGGAGLGMIADVFCRGQRVGHLHHPQAELLFHSLFAQLITPSDIRLAGGAPGEADGRRLVPRPQPGGLDQFPHNSSFLSGPQPEKTPGQPLRRLGSNHASSLAR